MERRYMISDASKMVDVESHVLRYWEEELDIEVPRNEMGHRYYTDYYINLFKSIKDLKDQGFLLKAIKMLMPRLSEGKSMETEEMFSSVAENNTLKHVPSGDEEEFVETALSSNASSVMPSNSSKVINGDKLQQFQMILTNIVVGAMEQNNACLSEEVSSKVSENVIKEMDYLLRLKEEREEERFKKIDELIRNSQKGTKEALGSGKKGLFRRK
ncbi:MAG: MerR family transcriptional regulator [Lachnospiraceae bacterium]|nr:MerR family transcriptional regulator [Lachnospiraceae bacterium]